MTDKIVAGERKRWLDDRGNVTLLYRGLWIAGILLVLADLVVHRHEDFGFAGWFGYYAVYGFIAIVLLVYASVGLRRLVRRSEDYYER
ncbi:MAG: hypothetical protein AB7O69_05600 [Burkholderiales bacterium]